MQDEPRILFCRSGGGLPGIDIHVGIWLALYNTGIHATVCHGTSAGAIVSALDSADWHPKDAQMLVESLTTDDVIDWRTMWKLRIAMLSNVCSGDAVIEKLNEFFPKKWTDYKKPISTWATQAGTSRRINTFRDTIARSPIEAVAMSSRIPAVFPPIKGVDGLFYVDGGMRANLPLPPDWRDYDEVWLLIATGAPACTEPSSTVLGNALRAFRHLMADQILDVLEEVDGAKNVRIIWPKFDETSVLEFDHSLIQKAHEATCQQLTEVTEAK